MELHAASVLISVNPDHHGLLRSNRESSDLFRDSLGGGSGTRALGLSSALLYEIQVTFGKAMSKVLIKPVQTLLTECNIPIWIARRQH